MKKALILALLLVPAALGPCARTTVELPDQDSGIVSILTSPLFWHLWDQLLDRQLSHWTATASHRPDAAHWTTDALGSLCFQVLLSHAIDGFQSSRPENDCVVVAISKCIVRRTMERPFQGVHELPAQHRGSRQNETKERS